MSYILVQRVIKAAILSAMVVVSPVLGWSQDEAGGAGENSFIQRFDQDGDGLISTDEFPGDPDQFQRLDIDEDGYLDAAEAPLRRHPRRPAPHEVLAEFDTDADGQLSVDEFPGPEEHFDNLDTDGNSFLSQEELLDGRPDPPRGGSGFERDDANQDGRVSRAEFSGPEGLFNRLDSDGDGYISQAEARPGDRQGGPRGMVENEAEHQY